MSDNIEIVHTPEFSQRHEAKALSCAPSPQPDPQDSEERDDIPPLYTTDAIDVRTNITQLAATLREHPHHEPLPITTYPVDVTTSYIVEAHDIMQRRHIVDTYFDAVRSGNVALVASFLGAGLITTASVDATGKTPLLAAIDTEQTRMVRYLLDIGADIDAYGITATTILGPARCGHSKESHRYRTPLQYAAQTGNLPIVRLLVDRGANDALVAPDGQLALRLAAAGGHREIVGYLPSRRGGGFKRWKAKHAKAVRKCEEAAHACYRFCRCIVWDIPRFFVWSVPKHVIVLPLVDGMKWMHEHRKEIPKLVANAVRKLGVGLKKLPSRIWEVMKEVPSIVKAIAKAIRTYMWRIPNGAKIVFVWLWRGMKSTGLAIGRIFERLVSLLHTVLAATMSFFRRITIGDILRALQASLYVTFVVAPKQVWAWACTLGESSRKALVAVFGTLGRGLWLVVTCLLDLVASAVLYIPGQAMRIAKACANSVGNGGKEVLVWIDPKRV